MKTITLNRRPLPEDAVDSRYTSIPTPHELKAEIPLSARAAVRVEGQRQAIRDILRGEDRHRLLVICGPCSIHDANAAYEYAQRLARLAREVEDDMLVVMRTYFEKPRSVVGWKGLFYDPELAGSSATVSGLALARRILSSLVELDLPCATEFLNPALAPYQEDLIAYGSIGARTVESQIHRELAAGLSMPVGMKNSLSGDLGTSLNAVRAASLPHSSFSSDAFGRPAIAHVPGNPFAHPFLRGGESGPNLDSVSIRRAHRELDRTDLRRSVVVDCSHANSGKDFRRQWANARQVASQFLAQSPETAGFMLESNLEPGRQDFQAGQGHLAGCSITDGCIGWAETESLLREIALELKTRSPRKKKLPSL